MFIYLSNSCLLCVDVYGSDDPIPLSPHWLLPKPGDKQPRNVSEVNIICSFVKRRKINRGAKKKNGGTVEPDQIERIGSVL